MRRLLPLLLVALLAAPGTWVREPLPRPVYDNPMRFLPLPVDQAAARTSLSPFVLEGAWRIASPHAWFGSFSALGSLGDGTLLAVSDRGYVLRFAPPGAPPSHPWLERILRDNSVEKRNNDAEALTVHPPSGTFWIAWEDSNAISRHATGLTQEAYVRPQAMQDWGGNVGPETLVRLANGKFLVLREGGDSLIDDSRHRALLFHDDPADSQRHIAFTFTGPEGFSPTDATQLPDGRILVLMRKLLWPFPARFAGRIMVVDPDSIEAGGEWTGPVVARLTSSLPVDNFEGITVEPRDDGTVTVWLMSDDNDASFQATVLWKLKLDPARLPH